MASAVLASRNEPHWGERKVYTRKYPNSTSPATASVAAVNGSNSNHKSNILFTENPNPNPNKHVVQALHDRSTDVIHLSGAPSLAVSRDFTLKETSRAGHVTFSLDAYTRRELKDLKKRLLSELQQVRILRTRMESTRFGSNPISPPLPPAQLPLPPPPLPAAQKAHSNRIPKSKKKVTASKRRNHNQKRPVTDSLMRNCWPILTKLMKHKYGWVFNSPVDVVSLGLHDYNDIIKTPMDLGTVKSNLENQQYGTVLDFASDVRLTFNNAMKYNPKGHDVYVMAETLLGVFEKMFNPVGPKLCETPDAEASALMGKPPRPKAKATSRREMSFEEKSVLGRSLVELPQEKMAQLLSILRKRNSNVSQDGDEIELDIEAIDNETLWELDRFVRSFKKAVNKNRKDAGEGEVEKMSGSIDSEVVEVEAEAERLREEDVDIGEEIPVEHYPPVEIERDVSSSSGHSSSSSGSSSGSGSDDDNDSVQSPFVEAKDAHAYVHGT